MEDQSVACEIDVSELTVGQLCDVLKNNHYGKTELDLAGKQHDMKIGFDWQQSEQWTNRQSNWGQGGR